MSGGSGGVREGHSTVQPNSVLVLPAVPSPAGGYSFQLLVPHIGKRIQDIQNLF